jgi:adenylate cyclase
LSQRFSIVIHFGLYMSDLIAQGSHAKQRWRRALPAATTDRLTDPDTELRWWEDDSAVVVIGRNGTPGWQVNWDDRVSRQHAQLRLQSDGSVLVRKVPTSKNPIFYRGQKKDAFRLMPSEHFVIGHTTFTLATRPEVNNSDHRIEVTEHVYNALDLRGRGFRDAAARIDALGRLPDIIVGSTNDEELLVRVVSLLLQSIPSAAAVAILDASGDDATPPRILHYDNRIAESIGPRPSARIARQSLRTMQSVLHLWSGGDEEDSAVRMTQPYTASEGVDWAFCVPLPTPSCNGWVIYITGQLVPRMDGGIEKSIASAPDELHDDIKFAELVGTTLGNLRQSRLLQRQQLGLLRFFSPVVMDAIAGRDADEVLRPRESDVSVMFCDLRGFTRQSEQSQDRLLELLQRVSDALGVMTGEILRTGGVVGDFHGDAAMGFWGWPLDQPDSPARAARAALTIREAFYGSGILGNADSQDTDGKRGRKSVNLGFRCGIGLATGRAVAGRIGTVDQVKVTAFGPVVNLASRLEGMTKVLGAEVLVDQMSADWIRNNVTSDVMRVRRLARVRPAGILQPIDVYQLLRPRGTPGSPSDEDVRSYEIALDAMIAGDWEDAFDHLHRVASTDRAKDFLTATILRHGRTPPPDWNGVIDIPK